MSNKKFENIIIASDLDGTYFADGTKLVQRNIDKVRYFCENGGKFTFATGRLPIFTRRAMPNAKELVNLPAVTGNGTCLYDFEKGAAIEEHFLDMKIFRELAYFLWELAPNAGCRGVVADGLVIPDLDNPYTRAEYYYFPDFMNKRVLPIEKWDDFNIYKVNIIEEKDVLERLYPILVENFSDRLTVTRAGYQCIEVMTFGTSKAKMLERMVRTRFGNDAMLCTVGDHDNDIEMHKISDFPVCPANANDAVKEICKHCLCDNNSGVIADLIDLLDGQG